MNGRKGVETAIPLFLHSMQLLPHTAIYVSTEENIHNLTELIMAGKAFDFATGLEKKQSALFSSLAIRDFVKEELLHDKFLVQATNGHSLATSSSGEQRKALLQYLLAKKPGYIIADNVFENLDMAGQLSIAETLEDISKHTLIIQIVSRKNDCLSFIDRVVTIKDAAIIKQQSRAEFLQINSTRTFFEGSIPPPANDYVLPANTLVKMDDLSVSFNQRQVLKNICWEIKQGEFWQLAGPNGSGKSTLLSIITGDSVKGYGQNLYLFGRKKGSGETVWDIKQHIGYFTSTLSQEFPRQDSIEEIIIGGFFDSVGLYNTPGDLQITIARQWLLLLGLHKQKDTAFRAFTPGQQRMVLIARAMVKHPPLLILDEPASGLDDDHAFLFTALVNKIAAETSTAIIYVSHRKEAGLLPQKIFELVPSQNGSTGIVHPADTKL
jgi:molybdate transport system ATP-binding protein